MKLQNMLITGATDGLGRAAAIYLAGRGYHVWAGGRNPRKLAALREFARERQLPIEPVEMDVCNDAAVERAVAQAEAKATQMVSEAIAKGDLFLWDDHVSVPTVELRRVLPDSTLAALADVIQHRLNYRTGLGVVRRRSLDCLFQVFAHLPLDLVSTVRVCSHRVTRVLSFRALVRDGLGQHPR